MNWLQTPLVAKPLDWKQLRQLQSVQQLLFRSNWQITLSPVISQLVITTTGKMAASGTKNIVKQLCFQVPLDKINPAIIEDMPGVSVLVQNTCWLMTLLAVKPLECRQSR